MRPRMGRLPRLETGQSVRGAFKKGTANAMNGGGGNRTRVPKHFSTGIYVCSPSTLDRPEPCGSAGLVRPCGPRQAGCHASYPAVRFSGRRLRRVQTLAGQDPGNREPDLTTKPRPLKLSSRTRGSLY